MFHSTSKFLHNLFYERSIVFGAAMIIGLGLVLLMFIIALYSAFASPLAKACVNTISQSCIDYRMDECLASERYTREECILLVAGRQP